jgi:hypothetical protein
MTITISGTIEDFLREVHERKIPLTAKGDFSLETLAVAPNNAENAAHQERMATFREWTASHGDITAVVSDDSREAIYDDGN